MRKVEMAFGQVCAACSTPPATTAPLADRPVLLRREANARHGARSVSRTVEPMSQILAFVAARAGLPLD